MISKEQSEDSFLSLSHTYNQIKNVYLVNRNVLFYFTREYESELKKTYYSPILIFKQDGYIFQVSIMIKMNNETIGLFNFASEGANDTLFYNTEKYLNFGGGQS